MILNTESCTLDNVEYLDSPNYNSRPQDILIDTLVIHCISLPKGDYTEEIVKQFFLNQLDTDHNPELSSLAEFKVSPHLLVARDGNVTQFVPFDKRAWHAGESRLGNRHNVNDFSIGIELIGTDDQEFSKKQYFSLAAITKTLMKHYPITQKNIVGHSDIAPDRKTDPGTLFSWEYYFSLIK